jgi:zinc protease
VLGNGVVVLTARTTSTPAVTIHASFAAGTVWDPPATTGLSHFVSRVIDRGTVTRTAADIADALDDRGVSLGVTVNRLALSCTCTPMSCGLLRSRTPKWRFVAPRSSR